MGGTAAPAWSDTSFASMGSTARLLVLGGPPDLPDRARRRLGHLESLWTRFQPTSELARINAAAGRPVMVSHETFDVVALAVGSWRSTRGRFDPTVLDALERAGYDADFAEVAGRAGAPAGPEAADPTPGCGGVELLPLVPAVRLPAGVRLDLGGIGKGRAGDLLARELLDAGAAGVCVDLGGDVRVAGCPPEPRGWRVELDPALAPDRAFVLADGAVATSTRLRRAWRRGDARFHHLLDPSSGRPAWTGLAAVTVLARSAAEAEVLAKAAFVAGPDAGADLLLEHGVTGLLLHDDGSLHELAGLTAYLA
jgi:FAD:protein FMN transferase